MKFSDEIIDKVLYTSIYNKAHKRERSLAFIRVLIKNFRFLFYSRLPKRSETKAGMLFFSSKTYFEISELNFPLYTYKEKLPNGIHLNFSHEEHLLFLAFLMPRVVQRKIFAYVYRSIASRLDSLKISVFMCNNPEFISYVVGYYLKSKGAKLITMQHGTYSKDYQPQFYETSVADFCFVWGKAYKDCYMRGGVASEAIRIVAAPFTYGKLFNKKFPAGIVFKPLFLGQQLYKVWPDVVERYNKVLEELLTVYDKLGVKLVYKPHPREDVRRSLVPAVRAKLIINDKKNVTENYFEQYTHAYAVSSTSLIKALSEGLQCYQINLKIDINEIYAENTSVRWIGVDDIQNHLLNEKYDENYISEDYINLQPDPRSYNSKILSQIMHESA